MSRRLPSNGADVIPMTEVVAGKVRPILLDVPYTQGYFEFFSVVARTSGKAEGLVAPMTAAVREVDRDAAVDEGQTMSGILENSNAAYMHRSSAWLVAAFAGLALVPYDLGRR